VATPVVALFHVPVVGVLFSVVVVPTHRVSAPVIAVGTGLMVTTLLAAQLVLKVYIIVVVPALRPLTIPVPAPIVALAVRVLLHVPPSGLLVSVICAPSHTVLGPLIGDGNGFTSTTIVR